MQEAGITFQPTVNNATVKAETTAMPTSAKDNPKPSTTTADSSTTINASASGKESTDKGNTSTSSASPAVRNGEKTATSSESSIEFGKVESPEESLQHVRAELDAAKKKPNTQIEKSDTSVQPTASTAQSADADPLGRVTREDVIKAKAYLETEDGKKDPNRGKIESAIKNAELRLQGASNNHSPDTATDDEVIPAVAESTNAASTEQMSKLGKILEPLIKLLKSPFKIISAFTAVPRRFLKSVGSWIAGSKPPPSQP